MKRLLPLLALPLALLAGAVHAQSAEAIRRLQLAGEAITLNPPREAIMESNLSAHPMFQQIFAKLDMGRINAQAAELMAEQFTSEELQALVDFQKSPLGRQIQMKMPGYQKLLGSMVQNEMAAAFQAYMASQASGGASSLPRNSQPLPAAAPGGVPAGLSGSGSPIRR